MKNLIKSYKFWTALAGSIGLLAVSIGKVCGYNIASDGIEEIVMALCGVLIVFGVVKKPKVNQEQQETKEKIQKINMVEENKGQINKDNH